MNIEDINDKEIESMESEIKTRQNEYNNKDFVKHHGSIDDLNASEIEGVEAEIRARRSEVKQTEQHYGSFENLDENETSILEAQVAEKRKQDIPYTEYFNNLITNPTIDNPDEFEAATIKSMQSNGVMRKFIEDLSDKIGEKAFELKNTDIKDVEKIKTIKKEIENSMSVYQKYMYTLKDNQWDFSDIDVMKMPEYVKENLWKQQKRLDIVFEMPIPANLGKDYGDKFEREGKMIPGLELMYQDLTGKEVNWHQVLIYKENELTPHQKYLKRQELKSQIQEKQDELSTKQNELQELKQERQQKGMSYGD